MTTAFYASPEQFHGVRVVLSPDETRHAVRALRYDVGDDIIVVDGIGGWHRVRLEQTDTQKAMGTVVETRREVGEPRRPFVLAVGLVKKRSRYETLVEKAVELGITTLIPLVTERTERSRLRRDRLQNIMTAALKQCGRSRLPALAAPCSLSQAIARHPRQAPICLHEAGPDRMSLPETLSTRPRQGVLLAVGPEGGFTRREVALAERAGARVAHLGPRRLRTETAALAAASTVVALQHVDPAPGISL